MATDLAKLKKFEDSKSFRIEQSAIADSVLQILLGFLASNYGADIPSTEYSLYLKTLSEESARLRIRLENIRKDAQYTLTRPEFLRQNISYLLYTDDKFPKSDWSDEKFRNFLLSIIKVYLKGSKKEAIEEGAKLVTDLENLKIYENFLDTRKGNEFFDISTQFGFRYELSFDEIQQKGFDLVNILDLLNFITDLTRPAHTLYQLGATLEEDLTPENDTIEISDDNSEFHLYLTFNDSVANKDCRYRNNVEIIGEDITLQASPREPETRIPAHYHKPWNNANNLFHTKHAPIVKKTGNIGTPACSVNEVTVYIDNTPVTVTNIWPLSGLVELETAPLPGQTVTIDYSYFPNPIYTQLFNHKDLVLNSYKSEEFTEYPISTTFYDPDYFKDIYDEINDDDSCPVDNPDDNIVPDAALTIHDPKLIGWKFRGFELEYSSVFNSPSTLLFNKFQKNTGELGFLKPGRFTFNDFHISQSSEHLKTNYDHNHPLEFDYENNTTSDQAITLLPPGTPPVFITTEDRLGSFQNFTEDSYPLISGRQDQIDNISLKKYHNYFQDDNPFFYSGLKVTKQTTGSNSDQLKPICDQYPFSGMSFGFDFEEDVEIDHDCKEPFIFNDVVNRESTTETVIISPEQTIVTTTTSFIDPNQVLNKYGTFTSSPSGIFIDNWITASHDIEILTPDPLWDVEAVDRILLPSIPEHSENTVTFTDDVLNDGSLILNNPSIILEDVLNFPPTFDTVIIPEVPAITEPSLEGNFSGPGLLGAPDSTLYFYNFLSSNPIGTSYLWNGSNVAYTTETVTELFNDPIELQINVFDIPPANVLNNADSLVLNYPQTVGTVTNTVIIPEVTEDVTIYYLNGDWRDSILNNPCRVIWSPFATNATISLNTDPETPYEDEYVITDEEELSNITLFEQDSPNQQNYFLLNEYNVVEETVTNVENVLVTTPEEIDSISESFTNTILNHTSSSDVLNNVSGGIWSLINPRTKILNITPEQTNLVPVNVDSIVKSFEITDTYSYLNNTDDIFLAKFNFTVSDVLSGFELNFENEEQFNLYNENIDNNYNVFKFNQTSSVLNKNILENIYYTVSPAIVDDYSITISP